MKNIVKEAMIERLCDWFYKQGNDVLSYELIAKQVKSANGLGQVTQEKLSGIISRCRALMESRYGTTIINVPGLGYKLADPDELALHTAKWVKRTILYADRTYRLVDITDRRKIPGAIQKVFKDNEGRIKTLSTRGRKFVSEFVAYSKVKQMEDKSNEKKGQG